MTDLYSSAVMDAYEFPEYEGELSQPTVIAQGTNASCGDHVTLHIQLSEPLTENSKILDVRWQGNGCAISRAATELLSQAMIDQQLSLADIIALEPTHMGTLLGVENLAPGRIKCATLALATLQQQLTVSLKGSA